MKRTLQAVLLFVFSAIIISSCGKGAKDKKGDIGDKKVKLEKLKKEKNPSYVKKTNWEIIKIITKEGVFIPKAAPLILFGLSNSKQKVKRVTVSKRKIDLNPKAKQTKKAQVA